MRSSTITTVMFQSLLMYHLLTTGYHFNSTSWPRIHFVKRINDTEVGWGLGHATIQANSVPAQHDLSLTGMIVLVVFGLLLILLSVWAAVKVSGQCHHWAGIFSETSIAGSRQEGSLLKIT